ncbi:unnamed protein product [Brassicogethes aeneus]|uniref:Lipase domain-containing protein n=1 Tax=Brassicogethes aeneus TaxID=1431903 RepID=A0A9P0FLR6_BRAAE|nr:unnamed protein product [Brassicogethes aeneus]
MSVGHPQDIPKVYLWTSSEHPYRIIPFWDIRLVQERPEDVCVCWDYTEITHTAEDVQWTSNGLTLDVWMYNGRPLDVQWIFVLFPILCTEEAAVHYYLYTRNNLENPTQLFLNNDNVLSGSYINFTNPTKMYVPGFMGTYENPDSQEVKNAYLYTQDCNMILVDTSQLLTFLNRNTGLSFDAHPIGILLAEFIDYLITKGLKLTDLELIGISLGGQAIGIAGAAIKTAYDPSGYEYNSYPPEKRLDETDAQLVIVIHTNPQMSGYDKSCGHVDFWINNNLAVQPGCTVPEVIARGATAIITYVSCSHAYSYHVAVYAIYHPNAFPALNCTSYDEYANGLCNNNDLQYVGDQVTQS